MKPGKSQVVSLDLSAYDVPLLVSMLRASRYGYLADQIEAQTKPPRIPEPGWGGIVSTCGTAHGERQRWIRTDRGWTNLDASGAYLNHADWSELIDPVLIREGLS